MQVRILPPERILQKCDFVIHGGDISDFGLTKEFLWMRDIMNGLKAPYIVIIGNHGCLANGTEIYRKIFGEENFSSLADDCKSDTCH